MSRKKKREIYSIFTQNILRTCFFLALIVSNKYRDHFRVAAAPRPEFTEIIPGSILATKAINNGNDCVNIHGADLASARRESVQWSPNGRLIYAIRSRDICQYQFSAAVPRFSPRSRLVQLPFYKFITEL